MEFALADDLLSAASGTFDLVNSLIVLQHIPVGPGLPILFRLVDKVRPGGAFHLHFTCRTDGPGSRFVYWASANVPGVKVVQNLQSKRRWDAPAMQMNNYPMDRIFAGLASRGIGEFLVFAERQAKFGLAA